MGIRSVKPILFNTEMVRAILKGKKTVTRRVIKPQPSEALAYIMAGSNHGKWSYSPYDESRYEEHRAANDWKYLTPPYHADDMLWVRETWAEMPYGYVYRADCEECEEPEGWDCDDRWRPSIHMPKEAARIWLRVTNVRVERLREISEEDAVREGLFKGWKDRTGDAAPSARIAFMLMWDTTFSPENEEFYGWAANPWVWVIEFERCEKPKDAGERRRP